MSFFFLIPIQSFAASCPLGSGQSSSSSGSPFSGENPCLQQSPASAPPSNNPSATNGNPISIITGNKYQNEIDYQPANGIASLLFRRHYNSLNISTDTGIGLGWSHSFDVQMKYSDDQKTIQINQSDGRRIIFTLDPKAKVYRAVSPSDGTVGRVGKWPTWILQDGRQIIFNSNFPTKIVYPGNHSYTLKYTGKAQNKKLSQVTDAKGRTLLFNYSEGSSALANFYEDASNELELAGHLQSITLPDGGVISYSYDSDHNLSKATYPDGTSRIYHYEDIGFPNHLTGITNRSGVRYATWAYTDEGRANLSTHADGAEKVTLEYRIPEVMGEIGTTISTNSLGQKNTYTWRFHDSISQFLLLSSEGPGCVTCPPTNKIYTYNDRYQIATSTDTKSGDIIVYDYDALGRTTKIVKKLKDSTETLIARYEYDGNLSRPTLIARPSVNSNGEHVTKVTYNEQQLPVSLTETGFSPLPDGSFETIERTTNLQYSQGNLTLIDGPRNDVQDLTKLSYDEQNRIQSLSQADGQIINVLGYDVNGRPTKIQQSSQSPLFISYNPQGKISEIKQRQRSIQYTYDIEGRLTKLTSADGDVSTLKYDDADRLSSISDHKGRKIKQLHDSESRRTLTQLIGSNGDVLNSISYLYDAQRRLAKTQIKTLDDESEIDYQYDDKGQLVHVSKNNKSIDLNYNDLGQLLSVTQPGDVATQYSYDNKGQNTALTDPRDNKTQVMKDDFGRTVQHISPDTGTNLYSYDASGNRIQRTDADGNITTYQWNAANQIISNENTDGITTFTYDVNTGKLASTSNKYTTESFDYNNEGHLITHTRKIDTESFTTSYEYNEQDKLYKKHLPDGQTLRYHYYAQGDLGNENNHQTGKLRAITRESLFGMKQENIVSEIDHDSTDGKSSYLSHNGLQTQYTYREDGQLQGIQIANTLKLQYTYDPKGNITGIDENGTLQSYDYDQGRLSYADTLTGLYKFSYDKVGNRTHRVHLDDGTVKADSYEYPEETKGNRLLSKNKTQGQLTISKNISTKGQYKKVGHRLNEKNEEHDNSKLHKANTSENTKINTIASKAENRKLITLAEKYSKKFQDVKIKIPDLQISTEDNTKAKSKTNSKQPKNTQRISTIKKDFPQGLQKLFNGDSNTIKYNKSGSPETSDFFSYEYNANQRPVKVFKLVQDNDTNNHELLAEYQYNSFGERIKKVSYSGGKQSKTTYYLYDGHTLTTEIEKVPVSGGVTFNQFIYLNKQPIAKLENKQLYAIHSDLLGTPKAASNDQKQTVWKASYTPFGKATVTNNTIAINLRLPGQYEDQETGTHYNYLRDYDPETGRYITSDPIGLKGGINTYAYVKNNPLELSDRLGLAPNDSRLDYLRDSLKPSTNSCSSINTSPLSALNQTTANQCSNTANIQVTDNNQAPDITTVYTIASGDTLANIAIAHGTSTDRLQILNDIENINQIRAGDTLLIPLEGDTAQFHPSYTVVCGDTLSELAEQFGIPLEDLIKLNEDFIDDIDLIYIGQEIIVTDTDTSEPVPTVVDPPPVDKCEGATPPDYVAEAQADGIIFDDLYHDGLLFGEERLVDRITNLSVGSNIELITRDSFSIDLNLSDFLDVNTSDKLKDRIKKIGNSNLGKAGGLVTSALGLTIPDNYQTQSAIKTKVTKREDGKYEISTYTLDKNGISWETSISKWLGLSEQSTEKIQGYVDNLPDWVPLPESIFDDNGKIKPDAAQLYAQIRDMDYSGVQKTYIADDADLAINVVNYFRAMDNTPLNDWDMEGGYGNLGLPKLSEPVSNHDGRDGDSGIGFSECLDQLQVSTRTIENGYENRADGHGSIFWANMVGYEGRIENSGHTVREQTPDGYTETDIETYKYSNRARTRVGTEKDIWDATYDSTEIKRTYIGDELVNIEIKIHNKSTGADVHIQNGQNFNKEIVISLDPRKITNTPYRNPLITQENLITDHSLDFLSGAKWRNREELSDSEKAQYAVDMANELFEIQRNGKIPTPPGTEKLYGSTALNDEISIALDSHSSIKDSPTPKLDNLTNYLSAVYGADAINSVNVTQEQNNSKDAEIWEYSPFNRGKTEDLGDQIGGKIGDVIKKAGSNINRFTPASAVWGAVSNSMTENTFIETYTSENIEVVDDPSRVHIYAPPYPEPGDDDTTLAP
ncbi:RHS repeat-associated core domain-containing protein [Cocleimonas flava]|uniref:RHS repeat-associated core domain-containing protein n=1 Tax=Cocleimonas flava TaxID=634765 RepID=UPI0014045543|nr:RHS repeat-associated core domain-containing protein [Cocleimonas flava]